MKAAFNSLIVVLLLVSLGCNETKPENKEDEGDEEQTVNQNAEIKALEESIISNPYNPELYYNRAIKYFQKQENHLALEDLNKAISIDSSNFQFLKLRSKIHFKQQNFPLAIIDLNKCYHQQPEDTSINIHLAKLQMYVGEYEQAFKHLNSIIKVNVHHAESYFLKAYCYKELKDTTKAISNFQTATEQDPDYYQAYLQLALLTSKQEKAIAIDYFKNALRIFPESKEALYGLGVHHQQQSNFQKAIKTYRKIALIDNQYEDAFYNIGYIYLQLDSIEKAKRYFNMAIQVSPYYSNAYYNRGVCSEKLGNFAAAKTDFEQALTFDENHILAKEALKRNNKK